METPQVFIFRGHKVLLDFQLASLYGVTTKRLNEQVRRNPGRFPVDFMFQLDSEETRVMWSQIATTSWANSRKYAKADTRPLAFTHNGVAMLSGVLHSQRAIQVNISIMRLFVALRPEGPLAQRVGVLEEGAEAMKQDFAEVFERLDQVEEAVGPTLPRPRRKIGLKS